MLGSKCRDILLEQIHGRIGELVDIRVHQYEPFDGNNLVVVGYRMLALLGESFIDMSEWGIGDFGFRIWEMGYLVVESITG